MFVPRWWSLQPTDQGILSDGEEDGPKPQYFTDPEAGLMYMIILLLQRLLTNTLIIKSLI